MTTEQKHDNNHFGFRMPNYSDFENSVNRIKFRDLKELYAGVKVLFGEKPSYDGSCSSCNEGGKPCAQHGKQEGLDKLKNFFARLFTEPAVETPEPADVARCIDGLVDVAGGLESGEGQKVQHAKIAARTYMLLDNIPKKGYDQTRAFIETFAKYHADRAVGKKEE